MYEERYTKLREGPHQLSKLMIDLLFSNLRQHRM
jgi:hypothetical protein